MLGEILEILPLQGFYLEIDTCNTVVKCDITSAFNCTAQSHKLKHAHIYIGL